MDMLWHAGRVQAAEDPSGVYDANGELLGQMMTTRLALLVASEHNVLANTVREA